MTWLLKNKKIYLEFESKLIKIDALTIYKAEFREQCYYQNRFVDKPSKKITNIKFTKDPADIKFQLYTVQTSIFFRIILTFKDEVFILNDLNLEDDYIIQNDFWIPLIPGKKDDINKILEEFSNNPLSLKQSLDFKKSAASYGIDVEDNIKNEILTAEHPLQSPFFNGTLYTYQIQGFQWMNFMLEHEFGLILADEMGLGKSIQVIRLICQRLTSKKKPFLIVAPASILENWNREFTKFTNDINILVHQGPKRSGSPQYIKQFDVTITSYETLSSDFYLFRNLKWDLIIVDEAQAIKNPYAQRTKTIKQLISKCNLAVTGTPFENKLTDVWSLIDFTNPGYLSNLNNFEKCYQSNVTSALEIQPVISPVILRRKVAEVAKDLPERILIDQAITLDDSMIEEYENIRITGLSSKNLLASFTKLRMFCCDPSLTGTTQPGEYRNNKFERLMNILEEILSLNEKVIIFTSFQKMIDLLSFEIKVLFEIYCEIIDGRTPITNRQNSIDNFSEIDGSAILILNPKAAGTGLNITAANHVIHYNGEWNPAVEDQASARAYRRGQLKPVRIYRLFYTSTIDELILERITHKREVSEAAILGVQGDSLAYEEIIKALKISPKK